MTSSLPMALDGDSVEQNGDRVECDPPPILSTGVVDGSEYVESGQSPMCGCGEDFHFSALIHPLHPSPRQKSLTSSETRTDHAPAELPPW
jgi:hypothetical protein